MRFLSICTGLFILAGAAYCNAGTDRSHRIVSDDYFSIDTITNCSSSPSGNLIAYSSLRWDKEADKRNSDIWVCDVKSHSSKRLTFDLAGDNNPQWGADDLWIYFTSARKQGNDNAPPYDGATQVWRIAADGSRLMPVTRIPDGIHSFQLSDNGQHLYYTTGKEVVEDEWKEMREKNDFLKYGHGVNTFNQIWKLDLDSWRKELVVDEQRVIRDFAVSPDEQQIAMITTPTGELITHEGQSRLDIYNVPSSQVFSPDDTLWRREAPSPYGWLEALAWSADSRMLAFGISFDGYPSEVFVVELHGENATLNKLRRDNEITLVPDSGLQWRGQSKDLLIRGEWQALGKVYCVKGIDGKNQGETVDVTPENLCADRFDCLDKAETMALLASSVTHPPDLFLVFLMDNTQSAKRLTKVNPQVDEWKLPQMSIVEWTSPDGTKVQGILELPPGYRKGDGPLPMILELHGGPTAASLLRMRFWIYGRVLMAANGYAVLSPNYRGSTGYPDKFMTDLIGHKNDRDVADILSGVDAMVERGVADPEKLGVMGWSNGGYLTNCLITQTNRFKAASSGAGVFDVTLQWAAEDTPGHVVNFQQGFPWNATKRMLAASPMFQADRITTPTLIHVGENDKRCPPENSKALYRALHQYLHVPTELVVYPGEGHGLTTYKHRKAKMEWDLKWFDRYLSGNWLSASEVSKQSDSKKSN